jgi:hypothetical protein
LLLKNEKGELVCETDEIMRRWTEYFAELLIGPGDEEQ